MSKLTHFSGINFSLAISVKPETKIRKGKMKIDFHDTYAVVSVFFFLLKKANCYGQVICSIVEQQIATFLIKFKHRCVIN